MVFFDYLGIIYTMKVFLFLLYLVVLGGCDCTIACKNRQTGAIAHGLGPCTCQFYGDDWVRMTDREYLEYRNQPQGTPTLAPPPPSDREYVFVTYSFTHRPGTGPAGVNESLVAKSDWIMMPNPENDGIFNIRQNILVTLSGPECANLLTERLADEQFKNSGDCPDWASTCYTINNNVVTGTGYRDEKYVFHCVPYDFWTTLPARADDKCFTPDNIDEPPCSDDILELDRDIYKSPNAYFNHIKKCPNYAEASLFVCD